MKKNIFIFALLANMVAMFACSDDKVADGTNPNVPQSSVTETITLKNNAEGKVVLPFAANMNWTASVDADWMTITPTKGPSGPDYGIEATYSENDTYEARTAIVTIENVARNYAYGKYTIIQPGKRKPGEEENPNAPAGMKKNAEYLVSQISVGWCLGNTCEASGTWYTDDLDSETAWGQPKTTKEMFTALKQAGFNAIRIPTQWTGHADADLNINDRWLNRIREIIDYAVSQDMYVIINSHHDQWYDRIPVGYDRADIMRKFENMWRSIATALKDYDEHVIFAGANEIVCQLHGGDENWNSPDDETMTLACDLMQTFVNTVRATGGNNEWRCLMVQPWAANPRYGMDARYVFPTDPTPSRIIFEYHCYDPYNYAIGKDVAGNEWAMHAPSDQDYQDLANLFAQIEDNIISKGIPAIMAEFGSTVDNHHPDGEAVADKIRADYMEFVVREAKKHGIPGFYWDNGGFAGSGENFGLLDRKTCTFPERAQIALDGIMRGLN